MSTEASADELYERYDEMRRIGPLHWDEARERWEAVCYRTVRTVLGDSRFSSSRIMPSPPAGHEALAPLFARSSKKLIVMDGPQHDRIRRPLNRVFRPDNLRLWHRSAEDAIERAIAALGRRHQVDLVRDFAAPIAMSVMTDVLRLASADGHDLAEWCEDITRFFIGGDVEHGARALRSMRRFDAYVAPRIARPDSYESRDVLGCLIDMEGQGSLSEEELLANVNLVFDAGYGTTKNLLANACHSLLRHPDQHELVLRNRSLGSSGLNELLRYESPVQRVGRIATADVTIEDTQLSTGQLVVCVLGAANRDPAAYPRPHRVDLHRRGPRHLGFGVGSHYCLGAPLALLVAESAVRRLMLSFPKLRLAHDAAVWRDETRANRGLRELAVEINDRIG